MRKVVITMRTDLLTGLVPPHFFDVVERIEAKAILRIDIEQGVKIAVCDITVRDGSTLKDVVLPDEWKILDILTESDNTYTCLLKTEYTKDNVKAHQFFDEQEYSNLRKFFESDIIFDLPFVVSKEKIVVTFAASHETMRVLLKKINLVGDIENISLQPASFSDSSVLSCLTERQKEVITTAKESGYYDVPRKTTTEELSKRLGISTATTLEHLRKAENRIISSVLAGY